MEFEFDPAKDEANRLKHGLALAFAPQVLDAEDVLILPSFREEDGEDRYKAVGEVEARLFTVIFVWRGEVVRVISVRRSNARERRDYDRYSAGPERPRRF